MSSVFEAARDAAAVSLPHRLWLAAKKFLVIQLSKKAYRVALGLLKRLEVSDGPSRRRSGAAQNLSQKKLTYEILVYCATHPDAKDTIEGILKWWRPAHRAVLGAGEVAQVLETLTAKGWLTKRKASRSGIIYGVNKTMLGEIEDYLQTISYR